MDTSLLPQVVVNGLSLGALYAIAAIGLTLVFGVLGIFNFAHGEFLMVGAYVGWLLFGERNVPFIVAAAGAMLVVGGVAVAIYRGLLRFTVESPFNGFIITLGLVYILQVSALTVFGPLEKTVPSYISGAAQIGGAAISLHRLATAGISMGVMAGVWVLLERTKFGRAVRASIQDKQAASLQGIDFHAMSAATMFVAGALAGLAGVLLGQTVSAGPTFGNMISLKAYIIVVVGGMASIGGTVAAAFLFGFLDSAVSSLIDPGVTVLAGVIVMLVVLLIRPQGLFSHE